jgi:hypothetical protein
MLFGLLPVTDNPLQAFFTSLRAQANDNPNASSTFIMENADASCPESLPA